MAQIVDVTDTPELPGAGLLHFDDGRPPLLALPEIANEHRERLGLTAMQNGVAGPGSGTPDPGPGPAPAPAAAPANPTELGSAGPIKKTFDPSEEAHQAQQARLDEMARTGLAPATAAPAPYVPAHWSPDSAKTTHEQGAPYDPEAAKLRLAAGNNVMDAQLSKMAAEKSQWDAQAAQAEKAKAAAAAEVAAQNRKIALTKENNARQTAYMNRDLEQYSKDGAPNPNHYFEQKGTFVNILSAIAQGLGAAGASLGHTQNFAMQITNDAIQRDMSAQEQAYNAGLKTRNNALERFLQYSGGDMEEAKSMLKQSMLKVAETETARLGALAQSSAIKNNAGVAVAQFQQAQLLEEQRRQEIAAGKTTTEGTDKFHQASGGGGGRKPLTLEQELALGKAQTDAKSKGERDQGALGLSPQAIARQKGAYTTKKEDLSRYSSALGEEGKLLGLHLDPTTGAWLNKDGKLATEKDVQAPVGLGYVGKHLPNAAVSQEAFAIRAARKNSQRLHAKSIYDKTISDEEAEHEVDRSLGNTPGEIIDGLRRRAEELQAANVATDAGAANIDPRIVNEYYRQKKAVNLARATGTELPGPMPMMGHPTGADAAESSDQ